MVPQLLGEGEGSVPLTEGQRREPPVMFLWVEVKPVPEGPGDGPIVPLGTGRQTVGCKMGLPGQERQETVSPLLRGLPETSATP